MYGQQGAPAPRRFAGPESDAGTEYGSATSSNSRGSTVLDMPVGKPRFAPFKRPRKWLAEREEIDFDRIRRSQAWAAAHGYKTGGRSTTAQPQPQPQTQAQPKPEVAPPSSNSRGIPAWIREQAQAKARGNPEPSPDRRVSSEEELPTNYRAAQDEEPNAPGGHSGYSMPGALPSAASGHGDEYIIDPTTGRPVRVLHSDIVPYEGASPNPFDVVNLVGCIIFRILLVVVSLLDSIRVLGRRDFARPRNFYPELPPGVVEELGAQAQGIRQEGNSGQAAHVRHAPPQRAQSPGRVIPEAAPKTRKAEPEDRKPAVKNGKIRAGTPYPKQDTGLIPEIFNFASEFHARSLHPRGGLWERGRDAKLRFRDW